MSSTRLELVWPNKDKFLLSPQDENGKPVWVERTHPAAREVRLAEFTEAVGQVNDQRPESDNLLFVGDSLDALRILNESPAFRREYRGKVKLIYIDPPFNTGQTFEHYDDWMEHSTWLSFMRDRLLLMKDLLSPEGSIWIHLDDVEQHHAKVLLDEIFGPANFVSTVVWQRQASQSNIAVFATTHEYIHVYARNSDLFAKTRNRLGRTDEQNAMYSNPDNDPRGPWASGSVQARNFYSKGSYQIVTPSGRVIDGPPPGSYWRFSESKFQELNGDNRIWWGSEGNGVPRVKRFLTEVQGIVPKSWWTSEEVGTSDMGKRESKVLAAGGNPFATPKPESLLQRILEIGSNPGEIVMDFFGGSGTTAAVAHKMQRRWVTVEFQRSTVQTFTAPRLRSVVSGADQGGISTKVEWYGGSGFRHAEIYDSFYAFTPLGVMLTEDATGPLFAHAVAGQLGFDWEPTEGQLCGRRGRMRLSVLDGAVGVEEARHAVSELAENERVTIVARVILPGTEEWLAENSRGSLCLKAPNDVLRERRKRRRANGGNE